jgi:Uma2 family endonuclease
MRGGDHRALRSSAPPLHAGCYAGSALSSHARRLHYTYREYLALEDESAVRHEYLDGEIYAMAGRTPDHAALAAAVSGVLRPVLPRGCRTFSADRAVRGVREAEAARRRGST